METTITTKRIAPGFYEGEYKGFKFQICSYNEGTSDMWWGVSFITENGVVHPNDESPTKKQCLDDAKYMMDNPDVYGIGHYRNQQRKL